MARYDQHSLGALSLDVAEALWVFDELPVQVLEGIAVDALSQGFDGPALRELAWSHASWGEVGDFFRKALAEMGRPEVSRQEAITRLIRWNAAKIVSRELSPFEGAKRMFYDVWWHISREDADMYESIIQPLRWANIFEDDPTEREAAANRIVERARQLLEVEPMALSDAVSRDPSLASWKPAQVGEHEVALFVHQIAPEFRDRWQGYLGEWKGGDGGASSPGLCLFMMEFARYVGDAILADASGWRETFPVIEQFMSEGDEEVRTATATCFLESLVNRADVPASAYVSLLGPMSRQHCKAWDLFTGVETEGLWEPK